jgi:hypothetical protein
MFSKLSMTWTVRPHATPWATLEAWWWVSKFDHDGSSASAADATPGGTPARPPWPGPSRLPGLAASRSRPTRRRSRSQEPVRWPRTLIGSIVLRKPAQTTVTLPAVVAEHAPPEIQPESLTFWKLGDPPLEQGKPTPR